MALHHGWVRDPDSLAAGRPPGSWVARTRRRPPPALGTGDVLDASPPHADQSRGGRRWCARSWRVSDELTDGASQLARLVFRDQGVTIGDLHQPRAGKQRGQPPSVCRGHNIKSVSTRNTKGMAKKVT